MDIILNTHFNNPNLPVVPLPGFYDDFTGGGGDYYTLGVTHENKPWDYMGGIGWYQRSDDTATGAGYVGDQRRSELAVVNGHASHGALTAQIALASVQDNRYGLAVRVTDNQNFIYIAQNSIASAINVYERVGGNATVIAQANGATLNDGDVLEVRFLNDQIEVRLNSATIMTATSNLNVNATHHGFFNWSSDTTGVANPRWDWIRFE